MLPNTLADSEDDAPLRQVNHILRNLRGEHFRHARNAQGTPASSSSLSSHAHNQPTLPVNLIYTSQAPETSTHSQARRTWIAGPSPPRSWRSPASSGPPSLSTSSRAKDGAEFETHDNYDTNTSAWRERALSLVFFSDTTFEPSTSSTEDTHFRGPIYPNTARVPPLVLLSLQLILAASPDSDFVNLIPYIPPHLRRALLRYTAVHAPFSQVELDALCDGTGHVNGELIVVGPRTTLQRNSFRNDQVTNNTLEGNDNTESDDLSTSWDSAQIQDTDTPPLLSLSVLSTPMSVPTFLTLPPTITHLALVNIQHQVPLQRLPTICPLLVLLDLSYNIWLSPSAALLSGEGYWKRWGGRD
ncbi:hypothetical protein BU15DRAFT_70252 [Melanogaster broomeanus]|nr:hypothetical protein BU15DRAFT_70252 [Melanogaster broomeanus]